MARISPVSRTGDGEVITTRMSEPELRECLEHELWWSVRKVEELACAEQVSFRDAERLVREGVKRGGPNAADAVPGAARGARGRAAPRGAGHVVRPCVSASAGRGAQPDDALRHLALLADVHA